MSGTKQFIILFKILIMSAPNLPNSPLLAFWSMNFKRKSLKSMSGKHLFNLELMTYSTFLVNMVLRKIILSVLMKLSVKSILKHL